MSLIFKGCSHDDAVFLVVYKSNQIQELVCKSCFEDPNLVNKSHILHVYNFNTGEIIR